MNKKIFIEFLKEKGNRNDIKDVDIVSILKDSSSIFYRIKTEDLITELYHSNYKEFLLFQRNYKLNKLNL